MKRLLALLLITATACAGNPASHASDEYNDNYMWVDCEANYSITSSPDSIAFYLDKMKSSGFDNVVVDVKSIMGEVLYDSDIAPYMSPFRGSDRPRDYDMMGHFIRLGHERNMRVFASLNVFAGGHNYMDRGIIFDDHASWQTICYINGEFVPISQVKTTYDGMVNAANPEVQEYELSILKEFVSKYPECDGIIFDRVRFESMTADYSDLSRSLFAQWSGLEICNWPDDVFSWPSGASSWSRGKYYKQWCEWRASVIHDFVVRAHKELKSINPGLIVGDYAGAWYPIYNEVGVNWASKQYDASKDYDWATPTYCNTGYAEELDLLMSGLYYTEITEDERPDEPYYTVRGAAQMVKDVTCGVVPVVGSIYVDMYSGDMSAYPKAVAQSVESTGGVMIFDLVHIRRGDLWDATREALSL